MNTIAIAGPTCLIAHLLPPSDRASSQVSARDIEYLEAGSELQLPAHRAARRGALAWSCQVTAQDQCGMCNIKCRSRAAGRAGWAQPAMLKSGAARAHVIRCSMLSQITKYAISRHDRVPQFSSASGRRRGGDRTYTPHDNHSRDQARLQPVSYTHLRAPRDGLLSRMPSSA